MYRISLLKHEPKDFSYSDYGKSRTGESFSNHSMPSGKPFSVPAIV